MTFYDISGDLKQLKGHTKKDEMVDQSNAAFKNNMSLLNISNLQLKADESQILSKSMYADLKTLNLKKTFSFL